MSALMPALRSIHVGIFAHTKALLKRLQRWLRISSSVETQLAVTVRLFLEHRPLGASSPGALSQRVRRLHPPKNFNSKI